MDEKGENVTPCRHQSKAKPPSCYDTQLANIVLKNC